MPTRSIRQKAETAAETAADQAEEAAESVGTSEEAVSDGGPDPSALLEGDSGQDAPEPTEPIKITYSLEGLQYRSKWLRSSVADLETEIRGWSSVERLPEDHGLSRGQLVGYLGLLNSLGDQGVHPDQWPSYTVMEDLGEPDVELEELPEVEETPEEGADEPVAEAEGEAPPPDEASGESGSGSDGTPEG